MKTIESLKTVERLRKKRNMKMPDYMGTESFERAFTVKYLRPHT